MVNSSLVQTTSVRKSLTKSGRKRILVVSWILILQLTLSITCFPQTTCDIVLCFATPSTWCNRLVFPSYSQRSYRVVIPGVNFNQPIPVVTSGWWSSGINPLVRQYLGCGGYYRSDLNYLLIARYVATQLDIQSQLSFWWAKLSKQPLGCHWIAPMAMPGMPAPTPALPATFSGGPITSLTVTSSLQDLYDATDWVVTRGTTADQQALLAVYDQLNSCGRD